MSSRRHRQEKIPNSSSSGRKSQETPGKFSRFGLDLWTVTKSLLFPSLFTHFHGGSGGSVGGPGLKAVSGGSSHCSWKMFTLFEILGRVNL